MFSGYWEFNGEDYVPRECPVSLEIICHPVNLKLMRGETNTRKNRINHIEYQDLIDKIDKFEQKHGDIFEDYYGTYTRRDIIEAHSKEMKKVTYG